MVTDVAHIRSTQHWTCCGQRTRLVARVVDAAYVRTLLRQERPEPGQPPEDVCRACYRRWREEPHRKL